MTKATDTHYHSDLHVLIYDETTKYPPCRTQTLHEVPHCRELQQPVPTLHSRTKSLLCLISGQERVQWRDEHQADCAGEGKEEGQRHCAGEPGMHGCDSAFAIHCTG